MRTLLLRATLFAGALLLTLVLPKSAHAQTTMHWGYDARRAARPGAYVPYDGESYSLRYNYPETPLFLVGSYGASIRTMAELDREERFEKFGTRYTKENPPILNRIRDRFRR